MFRFRPWPGTGLSGVSTDTDIGQIMNTPLKWMALAGLVCLGLGRAAGEEFVERPANTAQEGHRFLFVVETSVANRKFESGNRQALFDLIVSGVNGNMHSGDTYGVWTFNDEVRSGEFPITIWEKNQSLELAGQAAAFLQKQKYTKKASPSFLVDALRRLSDRVGEFNVFIISSGEDPISGTPFDQNINAAYKALEKQSARTGRPMVTTFAVRKCRPVRAGVVLAGDRIILPDRPPEMPGVPSRRTPPATNGTAADMSVGSNSLTTAGTAPAQPRKKVVQIVTKTNTPAVAASSASTNDAPSSTAPATAAPTTTVSATPPAGPQGESENVGARTEDRGQANVVAETPAIASTTTTAPAPTAPASIAPTSLAEPVPPPVSAPVAATTPIQAVSNSPAPSTVTAVAVSVPTPSPAPPNSAAAIALEVGEGRTETAPASNPVLVVASTGPTGRLPVQLLVPVGPATASVGPATVASNKNTAAAMLVMAREAFLGSNSNTPGADVPAVQGIVVQVRTMDGLSAGVLLSIGGTLLGAACLLLVLLLRRAPSGERGSLITQAMRPERKV
jgi:hypothetical protein